MSGLICGLTIAALGFAVLFAVAVAWARRCREQRESGWQPERWLPDKFPAGESLVRRATWRLKNFVYPYNFDPTERSFAWWSFGFAMPSLGCAAVAFVVTATESARVTANQLIYTYMTGGFFEIIGILTTVEALIAHFDGAVTAPTGWAKVRGPTFIVAGIALGFIGNVRSIAVP